MKKLIASFLGVMLLVFGVSGAGALTLNLTDGGRGDTGVINNAIFIAAEDYMQTTQSSGSGVIDPFLTIQKKGYEAGYNTDYRPLVLDTTRTAYNYSIQVSDLYPVYLLSGTYTYDPGGGQPLEEHTWSKGWYYEFLLDISEPGSAPAQYLTMHDLKFYLADDGGLTLAGLGDSIWDLDDPEDSAVQLDSNLWSGSGKNLDLFVYIPASLIGTNPVTYVYLYSAFGGADNDSNGGYEEWCMKPGGVPIPEPATMLLLGTGLIGLAGLGRKRFKRKKKLQT